MTEIEPTQGDRDAAAQAHRKINPHERGAFVFSESIEIGHEDGDWFVQAFARHRLAALEDAAKAVRDVMETWGADETEWHEALAAIRALKEQPR